MARKERIVTLSVASRDAVSGRMRRALAGKEEGAFISFSSVDLLCKVITPKRLEILRALAGEEARSIREVARQVGRDVKAVHGTCAHSSMPGSSRRPRTASGSATARCTWTLPSTRPSRAGTAGVSPQAR